jgi:hypothetical protein
LQDFPHALVYGPINTRLGIPNLYTSQGFRIERILKYSHIDDDITGNLFGRPWKLKLEIGCNGPTYHHMQIFQASDQLLDPADMAVYGCTPDPDRGHYPGFLTE